MFFWPLIFLSYISFLQYEGKRAGRRTKRQKTLIPKKYLDCKLKKIQPPIVGISSLGILKPKLIVQVQKVEWDKGVYTWCDFGFR